MDASRGNVHDAVNAAGTELEHLVAVLHDQGVADKDIQTNDLGVQQTTSCCPQMITGYAAYTNVAVKVHHLNNVDGVIAASSDAIGNDFRIQYVALSVSDPSAATKTARAAAMKDAGDRAKQWADLAGLHVGRLLGVSEIVSTGYAAPACSGGCGGGGGLPVQAGTSNVNVSVTVSYELT